MNIFKKIISLTYSQEKIKKDILENFREKSDEEKIQMLSLLDAENLKDLFIHNKDFIEEEMYRLDFVISHLGSKKQKEVFSFLEDLDLTKDEKLQILLRLNSDVKASIDKTNLPQEYINIMNANPDKNSFRRIEVNLDDDLEKYRGLDSFIEMAEGELLTEKARDKLIELCNICPKLKVVNYFGGKKTCVSSGEEYKEAEKWIKSVIEKLKPEYTDLQKLAIIDNEIGKKISYSPDCETEVFDKDDCRALWKIIASGYGVCNGIANIERHILDRVGIESEIVNSRNHSFLKIKNIEIPMANGEIIKGNTILDPTWNLHFHRFGAKPDNFCISYEEARKNDINPKGEDRECHKNDAKLEDKTIGLEEEVLRKIFSSVGLAGKDGIFPVEDLRNKSEGIHKKYKDQPEEDIKNQFLLLGEKCPEFAICQNSTMGILASILLNSENLDYRCMVKRVYDKNDEEKRPVLFVYIDLEEAGEKFYYADKEIGQIINLSKEEFIEKFDCYEYDLEKNNGKRFWEIEENKEEKVNLATLSGNIEKKESEGR